VLRFKIGNTFIGTNTKARAFTKFLNTENEVGLKMELQPWISFCDSRCTFCYFPNEAFSRKLVKPYLAVFKKELMAVVIDVGAYWALRRQK
jgi:coproporphyrinogen III oxidase-like Fe-S oxidoreductase